jgi:hypothetical protein
LANQWREAGKFALTLAALGRITLPDPRYERDHEYSKTPLELLKQTWRPEFTAPLREIARGLRTRRERPACS